MARQRGQSTRMAKVWVGATALNQSISTTQASMASIGVAEGLVRETLLRSRGNILVQATPDAAGDAANVAFGLIVVHSNALTIGTTALPGPIADVGADWLWHTFVPMDAISLTAADPNARGVVHRVEIDSKAMRRVSSDHTVVLMSEADSGSFASITAQVGLRLLFGH